MALVRATFLDNLARRNFLTITLIRYLDNSQDHLANNVGAKK